MSVGSVAFEQLQQPCEPREFVSISTMSNDNAGLQRRGHDMQVNRDLMFD